MSKVILFGGTSEGRKLHAFLKERELQALTCVATEYGGELLDGDGVLVGRMGPEEMAGLLLRETPVLVVDATHPYAEEVSRNIKTSCTRTGVEYLRVSRESTGSGTGGFGTLVEIVEGLKDTEGGVFVALGVKEAKAFTELPGYRERVWLRLLPSIEGLRDCLALGYPAGRLICMQGPFSKELNRAMFRHADAKILVTKESGSVGGFAEKLDAAKELGMRIFVLKRPEDSDGVSLKAAMERIEAL